MSRKDPQFNLRIPADLKSKVEVAAQENKRSATAEIIARLEASFAHSDEPRITTSIRREALSGEEKEFEPMVDGQHRLSDQQLWDVITDVLDSVLKKERLPEVKTKGPKPRSKFPRN